MDKKEILSTFRQAMLDEAKAIEQTIGAFGTEVIDAVTLIQNTTGKVIMCGVGKSGHIGKKLAASMSSMGTPAFFVHADEAVHGDLGMIEKNDVVILLSNSGETREVLDVLPSLNKIGAKKISITGSHDSTLAKASDVSLAYDYEEECDHLRLAPTVSSTLTLAAGDALAITLSKLKGFTPEDFHLYHPGGSLGKKLEDK